MITVFCSKKLEKFLGEVDPKSAVEDVPLLGNWNGRSFHVTGKRCLLFLNSKTCYCVLVSAVLKKDIGSFGEFFKERLVRQFMDDFKLGESGEEILRHHLKNIRLSATNNDKSVLGTMNQHMKVMPYYTTTRFGPVEMWDDVALSCLLNEVPISAKVWAKRDRSPYFDPREAMGELLELMSSVR
ncbi:MAG TPA: hypothetical protein VK589_29315 [Chryseolinea sp.]|nr:hypothetical protein [Chryseolinea sp.]